MSGEEGWILDAPKAANLHPFGQRSGYDPSTGIYHSLHLLNKEIPSNPDLDIASFVLSQFPCYGQAEKKIALIDSSTNQRVTYAQLKLSIQKLAAGFSNGLGVKKGDVVFLLSPNCLMYPVICLAVLSIGAVLTTANPVNTASEIGKQVKDSGAKIAISHPEEVNKLLPTGVPTLVTERPKDGVLLSVEELIECCEPLDLAGLESKPAKSDTAVILYSSGTTGASKGVELTHSNLIAIVTILKWSAEVSSSMDDVFLCFIPMFHVYGLAFFALGLLACNTTNVVMAKYDFAGMLEAIQNHRVNNIPAVPPVILSLVKNDNAGGYDLSSLKRIGSGAAPLSKEVTDALRDKFPMVEVRQGYGLTESCGAATFSPSNEVAKAHPAACGELLPTFTAKVVDFETGKALPPFCKGELWFKGPGIMKGYLRNVEATAETIVSGGWLRTGDLGFFDEDGCLHIVDRVKELIKHNGYQVAPAELEAVLLSHPSILDAAVVPLEDEAAGEIPIAYVVKAADSQLTEYQVIEFVASQVAPYKKVRLVSFIDVIPKSAAGKILRKDLKTRKRQNVISRL